MLLRSLEGFSHSMGSINAAKYKQFKCGMLPGRADSVKLAWLERNTLISLFPF